MNSRSAATIGCRRSCATSRSNRRRSPSPSTRRNWRIVGWRIRATKFRDRYKLPVRSNGKRESLTASCPSSVRIFECEISFSPTELAVRYLEQCCLSKRRQRQPDRERFRQRKRDCRFSPVASLQRKIPRECFGFVEIAAPAAHFWKSKRARRLARRRVGRRRRSEQAENRQIKTGFGQRSLR